MTENAIKERMMKHGSDVRLTYGPRWMIFDFAIKKWEVYERRRYAKNTILYYQGEDVDTALYYLFDERTA